MNRESKFNISRAWEVAAAGDWEVDDPIVPVAAHIVKQLREFSHTAAGSRFALAMLEATEEAEREPNHDGLVKSLAIGARIAERLVVIYTQAARKLAVLSGREMTAFFEWLKSGSGVGYMIESASAEWPPSLIEDVRREHPNYDPPKIGEVAETFHRLYLEGVADSKK